MLDIRKLSKISSNCSFILSDLQEVADEWQNELDDAEGNEPEYDSKIDRLTDAINIITEANDNFRQWINNFDNIDPNSDKAEEDYGNLKYDLSEIIDDYVNAQSNKKGIAQYINKLKKVISGM